MDPQDTPGPGNDGDDGAGNEPSPSFFDEPATEENPDASKEGGDAADSTPAPAADEFDARAEIGALRTSVAGTAEAVRNASRVPDIQRSLSEMERKLDGLDQIEAMAEQQRILTQALIGQLEPATQEQLRTASTAAERKAAVTQAKNELADELGLDEPLDEPAGDGPSPAAQAATARVLGYAEAKGVDPTSIPRSVFLGIEAESSTYDEAVTKMKAHVDQLSNEAGSNARRADRKADGEKQVSAPAATGAGSVSMERLRSLDESDVDRLSEASDEDWERIFETLEKGS